MHYGHLRAAVEVWERLGLSKVHMLPSARPPHRGRPGAGAEHRLQMVQQAIARQDFLVADDRELRREGPSYMVDTLADLRRQFAPVPLILIIGQDAANGLDRWHQWRRLFELSHLAVMCRPDTAPGYSPELAECMKECRVFEAEELQKKPFGHVIDVTVTQLEISSTAIRDMIAAGQSPLYLTPPPVIEYIREHGLYSAERSA